MFLSRFRSRKSTVVERVEAFTKPSCRCGIEPLTIVVNVPATVDATLAAQNFEHQLKRRGIN